MVKAKEHIPAISGTVKQAAMIPGSIAPRWWSVLNTLDTAKVANIPLYP